MLVLVSGVMFFVMKVLSMLMNFLYVVGILSLVVVKVFLL